MNDNEKENNHAKCSVCKRTFATENYLICCICENFCECFECFSSGLVIDPHNLEHEMLILKSNPKDGFSIGWNENEEALLISGIKRFGIGNWETISKFVRSKDHLECRYHYLNAYLESNDRPFPEKTKKKDVIPPPPNYDVTPRESYPSDKSAKNRIKQNEFVNSAEFCGYMPFRHEFEKEFNQNAEDLVCSLEFSPTMQVDVFKKYCDYLQMYNQQINERIRRNAIVEQWDIHHLPVTTNPEYDIDPRLLDSKSQEDINIDKIILPLSQYFPPESIKEIAKNLHYIELLRNQISNFNQWANHGITNEENGAFFSKLMSLVVDDTIPPQNIPKWNKLILDYQKGSHPHEKDDLLTKKERNMCIENSIPEELYIMTKDYLLKHIVYYGSMELKDAIKITNLPENVIGPIYTLFKENGWC